MTRAKTKKVTPLSLADMHSAIAKAGETAGPVLSALLDGNTGKTKQLFASAIAEKTGKTTHMVRNALDRLFVQGLVCKSHGPSGRAKLWTLNLEQSTETMQETLERTSAVDPVSGKSDMALAVENQQAPPVAQDASSVA